MTNINASGPYPVARLAACFGTCTCCAHISLHHGVPQALQAEALSKTELMK
jgi:hypothetical protein